jgi:hypothetical protein
MLAKNVNDNAGCLVTSVALASIASMLAPTGVLRQVHGLGGGATFCPCSTAHATTCVVS